MLRDAGWKFEDPRQLAKARLHELIQAERKRARLHIRLIQQTEPNASADRVAHLILARWIRVSAVEGGLTGAFGLFGIPLHLVVFTYCQVAVIVSIAEAYGLALEGEAGDEAVLQVLGRAHGLEDVVRAGPRVLGALARLLMPRYGLGALGRLVPMFAAPVAARRNEREMTRLGREALRRFGNVIMIES